MFLKNQPPGSLIMIWFFLKKKKDKTCWMSSGTKLQVCPGISVEVWMIGSLHHTPPTICMQGPFHCQLQLSSMTWLGGGVGVGVAPNCLVIIINERSNKHRPSQLLNNLTISLPHYSCGGKCCMPNIFPRGFHWGFLRGTLGRGWDCGIGGQGG